MSTIDRYPCFEAIKHIDHRIQCLVYGYIRRCELSLQNSNAYLYIFPQLIYCIILSFHSHIEFFTKHAQHISIMNINEINQIAVACSSKAGAVYGNVNIHGNSALTYRWTFKILATVGTAYIGIDSSGKRCTDIWYDDRFPFYLFGDDEKYKYQVYTEYRYGNRWHDNDEIVMELNTKRDTLKFYQNNVDLGIAFKDIDFSNNRIYHMTIRLSNVRESIQLLHFEICRSVDR
eukprot:1129777_1